MRRFYRIAASFGALRAQRVCSENTSSCSARRSQRARRPDAALWQHLFWFLAHPGVYVLVLPAMGIVGEIIANNTRKPLWGYRVMVYAIMFLGFMSFGVWAQQMFLTGMGTVISAFFQKNENDPNVPNDPNDSNDSNDSNVKIKKAGHLVQCPANWRID
jgi:hypothetical protein